MDNPDRVKYIVRSLFPFLTQDQSSCVVRREELFTHEELERVDEKLEANAEAGIDEVPNEILKGVIVVYPEILFEAFNSRLREGWFFDGYNAFNTARWTICIEEMVRKRFQTTCCE